MKTDFNSDFAMTTAALLDSTHEDVSSYEERGKPPCNVTNPKRRTVSRRWRHHRRNGKTDEGTSDEKIDALLTVGSELEDVPGTPTTGELGDAYLNGYSDLDDICPDLNLESEASGTKLEANSFSNWVRRALWCLGRSQAVFLFVS
jgi:hypothetical protein